MNQNETVSVLKEIYQSAKTATEAISVLIPKTHSHHFHKALKMQLEEYHDIAEQAAMQLHGFRELPDDASVFTKLGMWSAVQMNTITNTNTDHMAEIMINGSTMGIIDMTKTLRSNTDISPYAVELGQKLIKTEQNNIELMKQYL